MNICADNHVSHIVVGAGRLYLAEPDGGERYLGDSEAASITVSTEYITVESGDGSLAQRLVHQPRSVTRAMDMTLRDMTARNLSLYILGESGEDVQASARVADEAIANPRTNVWYQLGVTDDRPEGVWGVANDGSNAVSVVTGPNNGTAVATDKYKIDDKAGRIMFTDLSGVSAKTVRVTYTPKAQQGDQAIQRAVSSQARLREFGLRYIEDGPVGVGKRVFAPRCTIGPNGQMALKSRTSEQQLPLQVEILEPGCGAAALVIYGPED